MKDELSIVIPAYNEEKGIKSTLEILLPTALKYSWKIIVVNDGSTDKTLQEVEKLKGFKLLNHPYNKGYGAALKTGIRNANSKYIAMYDADGQHNPTDLESMWNNIENHDMLIGERGKNSHRDWLRIPGKWVLSKTANFLTGRKIPDLNSGLRIIKREYIIKRLHLFSDGFSFSTTSTVAMMSLGYNVGYYPIKVNKRIGNSTVNQFKHGTSTILLIIRLIMLFNPLKVFIPSSVCLMTLAIIYEVVWGIILIEGIHLLATSVFLLIASLLVFFFGLIADQISEIRKQEIR